MPIDILMVKKESSSVSLRPFQGGGGVSPLKLATPPKKLLPPLEQQPLHPNHSQFLTQNKILQETLGSVISLTPPYPV